MLIKIKKISENIKNKNLIVIVIAVNIAKNNSKIVITKKLFNNNIDIILKKTILKNKKNNYFIKFFVYFLFL